MIQRTAVSYLFLRAVVSVMTASLPCYITLGVIGVGMGRSRAEVQILEIIASDFIRDTDYCDNKTITRSARTLSVGRSYNM